MHQIRMLSEVPDAGRHGAPRRNQFMFNIRSLIIQLACVLLAATTGANAWCAAGNANQALSRDVGPGLIWVVNESTSLKSLTLAPGAYVMGPAGHGVTMTVNGIETGLRPGHYRGDIRLTVTTNNTVKFDETITHQFRQALYLDASGLIAHKSVTAAAGDYTLDGSLLTGARIRSAGENFNGVYVAAGNYTLKNADIQFSGNGGNDFAGYGAALMVAAPGATLVVDGARVKTRGVVRTAAVADKGGRLIVKNSELTALAGQLPPDYVPNTGLGTMKNVPWMLGLSGNNRATNLLGEGSTATYINSSISSQEWGVLSVDLGHDVKLTAINSRARITGSSGYGTYAIGNSSNRFYGTSFNVPDYGAIITGGHILYAASTPENVAQLNQELQLGLTERERAALPRQRSSVRSRRFGVMMWGNATLDIRDDTRFETGEAVFLIKNAKASIEVDGAGGAQLLPGNGVVLQLMDSDNPGPVPVDGRRLTIGVYHEPIGPAPRMTDFDVTTPTETDVAARFANISLRGDFYNSVRGGIEKASVFGPPPPPGRNLVLNFTRSVLVGRISSSTARHATDTISALEWQQVGEVRNSPAPAVNNGVLVTLDHSSWVVTGTAYLTRLTLSGGSQLQAPGGARLTMTVNGAITAPAPGDYRGDVVLQVTGDQ
jgi:hypothetical protein